MSYKKINISLIIPTLNAEKNVKQLMSVISQQTMTPDEVIVIDSQSDDATVEIFKEYDLVKIINIKRNNFDHGGTRNQAIRASSGDIILMLSQDVLPAHNNYIETLVCTLMDDESIAACSGRQIAYDNASLKEKLVREFNYKSYSFKWNKNDIPQLGIKSFFLSDCCAAYKRDAIEKVGMYKDPSLANEDMILVSKLLTAGYSIAYAADAEVYHSHDYTFKKQYKRNFDIGAGMDIDHEFFDNVSAESEGIKMFKYVISNLLRQGYLLMALNFCIDCAVRLIAHRNGKKWSKISKQKLKKSTSNLNYWEKTGYLN